MDDMKLRSGKETDEQAEYVTEGLVEKEEEIQELEKRKEETEEPEQKMEKSEDLRDLLREIILQQKEDKKERQKERQEDKKAQEDLKELLQKEQDEFQKYIGNVIERHVQECTMNIKSEISQVSSKMDRYEVIVKEHEKRMENNELKIHEQGERIVQIMMKSEKQEKQLDQIGEEQRMLTIKVEQQVGVYEKGYKQKVKEVQQDLESYVMGCVTQVQKQVTEVQQQVTQNGEQMKAEQEKKRQEISETMEVIAQTQQEIRDIREYLMKKREESPDYKYELDKKEEDKDIRKKSKYVNRQEETSEDEEHETRVEDIKSKARIDLKWFQPKTFGGSSRDNPVEFLRSFEDFFQLQKMTDKEKIVMVAYHLRSHATSWWSSLYDPPRSYKHFKELFMECYWSEDKQDVIRHKISQERYDWRTREPLVDFFRRQVAMLKNLSAYNFTERQVIKIVRRNLPKEICHLLVFSDVSDIERATDLLASVETTNNYEERPGAGGRSNERRRPPRWENRSRWRENSRNDRPSQNNYPRQQYEKVHKEPIAGPSGYRKEEKEHTKSKQ